MSKMAKSTDFSWEGAQGMTSWMSDLSSPCKACILTRRSISSLGGLFGKPREPPNACFPCICWPALLARLARADLKEERRAGKDGAGNRSQFSDALSMDTSFQQTP